MVAVGLTLRTCINPASLVATSRTSAIGLTSAATSAQGRQAKALLLCSFGWRSSNSGRSEGWREGGTVLGQAGKQCWPGEGVGL